MRSFETAVYEAKVRTAMRETGEELNGLYGDEVRALLLLGRDDLQPMGAASTLDLSPYENLMKVVKEASRKNIGPSELRNRIYSLGDAAVAIARRTGIFRATIVL
jgi:hypothetical protein